MNAGRKEVLDKFLRIKPMIVAIDSHLDQNVSDEICKTQASSMKYFVRI